VLKLGLTGEIAAGKSVVSRILREQGIFVVSADEIGRRLLLSPTIKEKLVAILGDSILENGEINHKKVAKIVFSEPKKLKELEAILHPLIIDEIKDQYNSIQYDTIFAAEVPLLFEAGFDTWFDEVWNITSNNSKERTKLSCDEYEKRSKNLISKEERALRASRTIKNNDTEEDLKGEILRQLANLRNS